MIVRPANSADHAAWLALWQAYLAFYQSNFDPEQARLTWDRLLDPAFNLHGFVAEDGAGLIGFTHCLFHPSAWTRGDYCYLQDLFVASGQRSRGVGRALIQAVTTLASSRAADRVYWLTQEGNVDARALYDQVAIKTGFIQYKIPLH